MDPVTRGLLSTAFALAVLVPVDVWVYLDARRRTSASAPVRLELGPFGIERPGQWLAGCTVLFVVFVPAYLVAREQPG